MQMRFFLIKIMNYTILASISRISQKCHTHSMEGHQKFQGVGVLKDKVLEAKYEAKLEFPGGGC